MRPVNCDHPSELHNTTNDPHSQLSSSRPPVQLSSQPTSPPKEPQIPTVHDVHDRALLEPAGEQQILGHVAQGHFCLRVNSRDRGAVQLPIHPDILAALAKQRVLGNSFLQGEEAFVRGPSFLEIQHGVVFGVGLCEGIVGREVAHVVAERRDFHHIIDGEAVGRGPIQTDLVRRILVVVNDVRVDGVGEGGLGRSCSRVDGVGEGGLGRSCSCV